MISSYIFSRSHKLFGKNTHVIHDCHRTWWQQLQLLFKGGCKILSPLPSCPALSLSPLSFHKPILLDAWQSPIPGTIRSSPSRYRAFGLTARRGAAWQEHQRASRFFIFVAGIALLCFSALNVGQMSGLKEPESSLHSRSVNFLFSNRPATNLW